MKGTNNARLPFYALSEARRMGDVDDFVVSAVKLRGNAIHGLVVYRPWGDTAFQPRHRRLLRLFHLELLRAAYAEAEPRPTVGPMPRLAPRLHQTLRLMLTPLSLKQIATTLNLSRHTINDYQKAIYQAFGVSTRAELLCHFRPLDHIVWPPGLL